MTHLPPRHASLPRVGALSYASSSGGPDVVVVGGGLCGLVVARELHKSGISVVVLEAERRLGGRVHTVTFPDGVTAEAHMEEFWAGSPATPLLRELGLPLARDHAHSSVVIDNVLHPYAGEGDRDTYLSGLFGAQERDAFLAWNDRACTVLEQLGRAAHRGHARAELDAMKAVSFAAFVASADVPHRVAEWIRVVVESETAVDWHRIAALDGVAEMRPFLDTERGFGELNVHVVGGNSRLVQAVADQLPVESLRTGAHVRAVVDDGDAVGVHYADATGRTHVVRAGHAIVTVPVWALRTMVLLPGLDPVARAAVATTGAGRYVKVILRLRREAEQRWAAYGPALFTLLTDSPVGCVYLSEPPDPNADLVLTMLVHGHHARSLNGIGAPAIARRALSSLGKLRVTSPSGTPFAPFRDLARLVTDTRVFDYPQAVAYWPVAQGRSRFDSAADALRSPHGRVLFGGDTTETSHSDGAVRSALRMAEVVSQRLGVRERVRA